MIETIQVEVAYATPEKQLILSVEVPEGATAREAVELSGIVDHFPDIEPDQSAMGIFSRPLNGKVLPTPENYIPEPKDRVEIYRPLLLDPKQARLNRARKNRPEAVDSEWSTRGAISEKAEEKQGRSE